MALYDLISGEARESELAGRLTDRAAQALLDANLFSMLVARSNGGLEVSRAEFFETVEMIAKADGSAGWCLSVCATTAFVVSKAASAEAKQEVFGDGPVALWTSLLPGAKSVSVEAGFRVSGRSAGDPEVRSPAGSWSRKGCRIGTANNGFAHMSYPSRTSTAISKAGSRWGSKRPRASTMQSPTSSSQLTAPSNSFCANGDARRVFGPIWGVSQSSRFNRFRCWGGREGAVGTPHRGA